MASASIRAIILSLAFVAPSICAAQPLFEELRPGEEVAVTFISEGCFHHFRHDFTFRGGEVMTVTVKESASEDPRELLLPPEWVERLDALFAFYRSDAVGGCTTRDTIRVRWKLEGRVVEEEFVDDTCMDFDPFRGPLSLQTLARVR